MIGSECFCDSAIEELALPRTLKKIHCDAFEKCEHLCAIYVEDGCEASFCGV